MMLTALVVLLASALCPGLVYAGDSYAIGGDEPVLWRSSEMQDGFPVGLSVGYLVEPPSEMLSDEHHSVVWFAAIDTSVWNLTKTSVVDGVYDVPHSNLHSCLSHIGFCTPLVSNTPGLSTHSSALVSNLQPDTKRGETWLNATFVADLSLAASSYTIITHVRFYTSEVGVDIKWDMAAATWRTVTEPAVDCVRGEYHLGDGVCMACPSGTHSKTINSLNCTTCPEGTVATASIDDTDGAGVASGAAACVACPEGTVAPRNGSTICQLCPVILGASSTGGATQCDVCLPGYFLDRGTGACARCPAHASCPGGTDFLVDEGWWHATPTTTVLTLCEFGTVACGGGNAETRPADDESRAGYLCNPGYRGMLCAVCEDGFFERRSGCIDCNSSDSIMVTAVPFVLLGLIILAALFFRIVAFKIYGKLVTVWRHTYRTFFCMSKFKIVWATYQIVASVEWSLNLTLPSPMSDFTRLFSLTLLNITSILPLECWMPYSHFNHLIFSCIAPLLLSAVIALSCIVRRAHMFSHATKHSTTKEDDEQAAIILRREFDRHLYLFLLLTFVVLPTTSTTILRTFACQSFENGGEWLVADFSLECGTPVHQGHCLFAGLMTLVYPVGVPMLYFVLLFRVRSLINPAEGERSRGLTLRANDKRLSSLGFLFTYYEPSCWYWEMVDSLRRIVLMGGLVTIHDRAIRATVGFVFSLASLLVTREVSPYLTASINTLATASQWQLVFTFFAGVIIVGEPFAFDSLALGWILLLVNVVLIGLAIVTQLRSGSAIAETEQELLELELRDMEVQLSIKEFRADIAFLTSSRDGNKDNETDQIALLSGTTITRDAAQANNQEQLLKERRTSLSIRLHNKSVGLRKSESSKRRFTLTKNVDTPKMPVKFHSGYFPCWVISLSHLQKLSQIPPHEEAVKSEFVVELTQTSRSPSCVWSYFLSQSWESSTSSDNASNTKLRWLQNLKKHLGIPGNMEIWFWWDLVSIPQKHREHQKLAIISLAYYATVCSRFIPLVRDEKHWRELYTPGYPGTETLPQGTLLTYLSRGWCRLELLAACCPKRFYSSRKYRPGPLGLRFRYHTDPDASGVGPPITGDHLLNPLDAAFFNPEDKKEIAPVLLRIAVEYAVYSESGATAWDSTLDVQSRPPWLVAHAYMDEKTVIRRASLVGTQVHPLANETKIGVELPTPGGSIANGDLGPSFSTERTTATFANDENGDEDGVRKCSTERPSSSPLECLDDM